LGASKDSLHKAQSERSLERNIATVLVEVHQLCAVKLQ